MPHADLVVEATALYSHIERGSTAAADSIQRALELAARIRASDRIGTAVSALDRIRAALISPQALKSPEVLAAAAIEMVRLARAIRDAEQPPQPRDDSSESGSSP